MGEILTSSLIPTPTYGMELEKVYASVQDGQAHPVGDVFFQTIQKLNQGRGFDSELKSAGDQIIGATIERGVESLDNSFTLGESATGPIDQEEGGLNRLYEILKRQLQDVSAALEPDQATVINMSNHPLTELRLETYQAHVAPKPVYQYLREVRGWNHVAGINAKAQNSPSVGIAAEHAVEALNVTLGISPALIALYANSPFDQGKVACQKESRLAIWDDMFGNAAFAGDRRLHQMPEQPFSGFKDYVNWMFAPDTSMYFVVTSLDGSRPTSEKGDVTLVSVDGHPNLLDFMQADEWGATEFGSGRRLRIIPTMGHFATHQFTQFSGARIRYQFKDDGFAVEEFNAALNGSDQALDQLFAQHGTGFYIEGRDPGASFPDQALCEQAGESIAESVTISTAAIHTGVIRNAQKAQSIIDTYGWDTIRGLREAAIKDGMQASYNGIAVSRFCEDVLELAAEGLQQEEQWMLAYPLHVLRKKQNAAERALVRFEQLKGSTFERISKIACERALAL